MLPLVVVVAHPAVCQSVREAHCHRLRRGQYSLPRLAFMNEVISPSEADVGKNNWKEPRSMTMSSADRVAHIDGQLVLLLVIHTLTESINA